MSLLKCWSYVVRKDCEDCPPEPKTELVPWASAVYYDGGNAPYEYGPGNGQDDNRTEKDGKFTEKYLKELGVTNSAEIEKYKNVYMYVAGKCEIDCYWLVNNTLIANDYVGLGQGPLASTLFPEQYFCQITDSTFAVGS